MDAAEARNAQSFAVSGSEFFRLAKAPGALSPMEGSSGSDCGF